jgi:hypothetical protein
MQLTFQNVWQLNLQAGLIPRISNGFSAEEALDLRGTRDKLAIKHNLQVRLTLLDASTDAGGGAGGTAELANVQRIKMAMKRTEQKQRLRQRVENLTSKYKSATKKRAGERHVAIDLVRAYNLPELPPGASAAGGAIVRVNSGSHGALSRVVGSTRHPPFAQTLQVRVCVYITHIRTHPHTHTHTCMYLYIHAYTLTFEFFGR